MKFITFFLFLALNLNGQTLFHASLGAGGYNGALSAPYNTPFMAIDGHTMDLQIEHFFASDRSFNLSYKQTKYSKGALLSIGAQSKAFYFYLSYNHSSFNSNKFWFYEHGPGIGWGHERVDWSYKNLAILGAEKKSAHGRDKMDLISIKYNTALGLRFHNLVLKLNVTPAYDMVLDGAKRTIFARTVEPGQNDNNMNFNLATGLYIQAKFSIGVILLNSNL